MILFFMIIWSLASALALYIEHQLWDHAGEIERYTIGTATILSAFSGWVISLAINALPLIWQDIVIAVWGIAGVGGFVTWLCHRADLRHIQQQDRHGNNDYPAIDQDI